MGVDLLNKSLNKQCRKFGDGRENGREDLGKERNQANKKKKKVFPASGIHGVKRKLDLLLISWKEPNWRRKYNGKRASDFRGKKIYCKDFHGDSHIYLVGSREDSAGLGGCWESFNKLSGDLHAAGRRTRQSAGPMKTQLKRLLYLWGPPTSAGMTMTCRLCPLRAESFRFSSVGAGPGLSEESKWGSYAIFPPSGLHNW